MKDLNMKDKVFTVGIAVRGKFNSSYVFESKECADTWLNNDFPALSQEYGALEYTLVDLPGLKIGDRCNVYGEGTEDFEILDLKEYSPHRYGFFLSSGWNEEVFKCHTAFL